MATRTTPTTRAARTKQPPPSDYVLIPIDAIDVGERYRGDPNKDLDTLAASIDKLGQLQPIVVTPPTDGRYDLLVVCPAIS
jgi:ParB-like nuclease domain